MNCSLKLSNLDENNVYPICLVPNVLACHVKLQLIYIDVTSQRILNTNFRLVSKLKFYAYWTS